MEFLIGRSLTNNITNLLLDLLVHKLVQRRTSIGNEPRERTHAGLATEVLAACGLFLWTDDHDANPGDGYGLRYEYGIFKQTIRRLAARALDNCSAARPWKYRPLIRGDKAQLLFEVRGGTLRAVTGRPSSLIGVPHDRPVKSATR